MEIFALSDQKNWSEGKAFVEELLTRYSCSLNQLAVVLNVPHPDNIIAVRHAQDWWLPEYVGPIMSARHEYDHGMVELATGRFGNHFFLYRFPRKKKQSFRCYFSLQGNGIEYGS